MIAKGLKIFGTIWMIGVSIIILGSLAMIFIKEGWWEVTKILSPFNIINLTVTLIALGPGIIALMIASHLEKKWPTSPK